MNRTPTEQQLAIVAAPDRLRDDTVLDGGRKPAELLAFLDLKPGMRVAELMAGYGYTSELIGRAVGPTGEVYAQNNRFVLEKFLEPAWTERLALPQMANVKRLDRELEAPFPAEVEDLDMVVVVLFYHDTYWQKVDRAQMNEAIYRVLAPGGSYVVIDHSARPGAGADQVQTLHRVEEALVREEIEAAGFVLREQSSFLRNDDDARDWNASPAAAEQAGKRGTSDRFVLRFVKP
ncbi:MAG: class I SAM-dependent methyltransferase [Deltaproteobacteria bacterium]|nr:class I SAM-dependent methyltransferase [Nannocystaceae bacterium]